MEAERNSIKYKQAEYLADKIGQEFDAVVSGISKWGVYAELKESHCEGMIPKCEKCGGIVKPSVVLYGEGLEKYTCMGACREISNCDTLIVAGTSLSVEPAASMLDYFHGKRLVVINDEPTPADARADLVIRGDVAAVMGEVQPASRENGA